MRKRERRYEWRRLGGDYPNPLWDFMVFLGLLGSGLGLTMLLAYSLQQMAIR